MIRLRRRPGFSGGLFRKLENHWWSEIHYSTRTGYFLCGPYGDLRSLTKEEGRLFMRGLAEPIPREWHRDPYPF